MSDPIILHLEGAASVPVPEEAGKPLSMGLVNDVVIVAFENGVYAWHDKAWTKIHPAPPPAAV